MDVPILLVGIVRKPTDKGSLTLSLFPVKGTSSDSVESGNTNIDMKACTHSQTRTHTKTHTHTHTHTDIQTRTLTQGRSVGRLGMVRPIKALNVPLNKCGRKSTHPGQLVGRVLAPLSVFERVQDLGGGYVPLGLCGEQGRTGCQSGAQQVCVCVCVCACLCMSLCL